jgi:hypothetical protein
VLACHDVLQATVNTLARRGLSDGEISGMLIGTAYAVVQRAHGDAVARDWWRTVVVNRPPPAPPAMN